MTYYFPYDLVISGQPGEISLRAGDAVDVVDVRDTELNPQSGVSVGALAAVLRSMDTWRIQVFSTVLRRLAQCTSQTSFTINDPRSVWMLVRPGPSGVGERVFVLPDRMVRSNGAVTDAPALDGDVYTYVVLPQVPIVLETLLVRTMDGSRRRCIESLRHKRCRL